MSILNNASVSPVSLTRRSFVSGAALGGLALTLAGCSSSDTDSTSGGSDATTTITVGASPSPHAEILSAIEEQLAEAGYTLDVVEYSDYVQPNVAVDEGDLDANFFQHLPYLEQYNEENGTDLVSAGAIHFEPMGLYSNTYASLDEIPDGAVIAVPSDATNEGRALLLLADNGIITLSDDAGLEATANDIVDNPYNIELYEIEAASVARTLDDVDFGIVNGNYALSSGLTETNEPIVSESVDSDAAQTYANIVCCRNGEENSDAIVALVEALQSDTARAFIEDTYQGTVIAVF